MEFSDLDESMARPMSSGGSSSSRFAQAALLFSVIALLLVVCLHLLPLVVVGILTGNMYSAPIYGAVYATVLLGGFIAGVTALASSAGRMRMVSAGICAVHTVWLLWLVAR